MAARRRGSGTACQTSPIIGELPRVAETCGSPARKIARNQTVLRRVASPRRDPPCSRMLPSRPRPGRRACVARFRGAAGRGRLVYNRGIPECRTPCCANSGSSSRRPAPCASPCCSSCPRCGRTCCRARRRHRQRRACCRRRHAGAAAARARSATYADAAKKAMPAVVNIYTSKEMRRRNSVARRPAAAPLFPGSRRADAAAAGDQPGLGGDRLARGLRAHQPPRDRGRGRHPARARRRAPAQAHGPRRRTRSPISRC